MSKPRWRRLIILASVLMLLPIVLLTVASILVPRAELAARMATEITAATGAQVEPGGAALKVIGGLGLKLTDGRIHGSGAELARRTGAELDFQQYDLEYSELTVSLGLGDLLRRRLRAREIRLAGPALTLATADGVVRLRDYLVRIGDLGLDLAELPTAPGPAPGDGIPADLSFRLLVRIAEVVVSGAAWQDIEVEGQWAARRFVTRTARASLGTGSVAGHLELDYMADPWGSVAWSLQLEDVPAGELLSPFLPELGARLDCDLQGEVTGSLALRDESTRLRTLTAVGRLTAGDGVLRAADWLAEASPYLGARQDLKTVRFSRLTHSFKVSKGRYVIDQLEIDGYDTDWQAQGWLGFAGDLNLGVAVRLPAGFTPDLGGMSFLAETLRDEEGRVRLALKLSGRMAAPQVGLDFSSLGRGR